MSTSRPTLAQVARLAGVSVASVSRALNGGSASRGTVEKVRAAVNELGYVPDATARLLKLGHTPAIACAVPDIANPIYVAMVKAMEAVTRREGFRLSLTSVGSDADEIAELVRSMDRGFADGLIITPLRVTEGLVEALLTLSVPVVVIGRIAPEVPLDAVSVDSAAGVRAAIDHLVAAGHDAVTLVNGPDDTTPGRYRLAAYLDAAAAYGFVPRVITATDFTTEAALVALGDCMADAASRPSAVLATNDLLAVGVMRAAAKAGVEVGPDLGVVGMDDTVYANLVQPPLTSVSLAAGERATQAIELLLARIARPGRAHQRVTVDPTLVLRESSPTRRGWPQ
ncbi:LacI family transcriptional regulator [Propioniciclava coleopterorum]|uniref:LacI family transcriptional regulator n=1 Tax=Propioniciclava coleopterorum TaxID=2714937 RepID=A0A6G7Y567_9ACTN|nr:LacI family DNA-binding transcriptional regulator [Propioniciclava coleopterorum]QIK71955.1 LacI family transcriptional regulator [Propioniciclava coleopterorum]